MEMVGVVDIVVAVAVIDTDGSIGVAVGVGDPGRGGSAGYVLTEHGRRFRVAQPGINRVVAAEVHQCVVDSGLPIIAEVISDFTISAPLAEIHPFDVAVGAVVGNRGERREATEARGIGGGGEPGVVGAVLRHEGGFDAIFAWSAGDDVDHTGHCVGAVEHRPRSAKNLHALHIILAVEVADGMGVYSGKLRLPVDHHEHSRCPVAADAAELDIARSAVAHSKAENAPLSHEETRHLPAEHAQQLRLAGGFELRLTYHAYRIGDKVAADSGVATRHHNLLELAHHRVGPFGRRCKSRRRYRSGDDADQTFCRVVFADEPTATILETIAID